MIGGVVAALAVTYLLRPDASAEVQALRAQIAQIDSSVAGLKGDTGTVAALTSRVDALEQATPPDLAEELQARIDALQQGSPPALDEELQSRIVALEQRSGPDLAGLGKRIDALEASLASGAAPGATGEQLKGLQDKLAALSANVAAQAQGTGDAAASDVARLETLQARLAAIESSLPAAGAADQVGASLDALAARVDALEPLGKQSTGNQEKLVGLGSELHGLEEQIQGLRERADAARAEVEAQAARLTQTEDRVAAADDSREQAALLALVASQIDGAIGQSRPYEVPLQGLKALAADDPAVRAALDALEPAATTGVPSLAELRRSFEAVAGEIVHQSQAPAGTSLLDQATGNLMRLVSVRPVGADVAGDDPPARVARAEADLAAGDLAAAVAEVEALDGPAAAAAAGWLAAARTRLDATAALGRLQARATELLAQSG